MCLQGSIQTMGFEMIGLSRMCQEVTYQNSKIQKSNWGFSKVGVPHPGGHFLYILVEPGYPAKPFF